MGFIERALGLQVPPMSMRSTAALDTKVATSPICD
jgi:hypothetical protein